MKQFITFWVCSFLLISLFIQDDYAAASEYPIYEEEPNDSPYEADPIDPYTLVYGKTDGEDVDFFELEVENFTGTLQLLGGIDGDVVNNTLPIYKGLYFTVINDEGEPLAVSTYSLREEGGDVNMLELDVEPGTYYIIVENSKNVKVDYYFFTRYYHDTDRIAGSSRYTTAVELSKTGWDQSNTVILTTGENFPDALSATPLAYSYDAPLLLTEPGKSKITNTTLQEIKRLKAKEVFIVGGAKAVSAEAEKELKQMNIKVTRIAGSDRYSTSVKVAEKVVAKNQHSEAIAVATGDSYADALSMAAVAGANEMPILLSKKDALPSVVQSFISSHPVKRSYVIGGPAVLSENVRKSLPYSERISGKNRYETNMAVIEAFEETIDFTFTFLATGKNYPDALAGSALAASLQSPIILVEDNISPYTYQTVFTYTPYIDWLIMIGGEKAFTADSFENLAMLRNYGF